MQEEMVMLDGVRIWTIAQGNTLPLMLCNGGPGCCDYLAPVAVMIDDLVKVYRWEQRGCGRSDAHPPYDHATCLADLEALRCAFGFPKWIIGGHSWGANLALDYAVAYPDRVLALIYLSGTGITEDWKTEYKRACQYQSERLPDFAYPFNQEVNRQGNESRRVYLQITPHLSEKIRALAIPALILYGDKDLRPSYPSIQVASLCPQGQFHVIPDAEHYLWLTHPQQVKGFLRDFIQEHILFTNDDNGTK